MAVRARERTGRRGEVAGDTRRGAAAGRATLAHRALRHSCRKATGVDAAGASGFVSVESSASPRGAARDTRIRTVHAHIYYYVL